MNCLHLCLCVVQKMDRQQGLSELCGSWPECVMWPAYSKVYFGYRVKHESHISDFFF